MEPGEERRLYGDLSWIWPIISPPTEYVAEAGEFHRMLIKAMAPAPITVLHLGCGGGHLDASLKRWFSVTGVDLSPSMLSLARSLNPDVRYIQGDMRSLRLGEKFDAVIIADSIAYMANRDDLRSAFETARLHLREGGIFITYVEHVPEDFVQNQTQCSICQQQDTEIVFIENRYDPDHHDESFQCTFVYLIRQKGILGIHTDKHTLGLFPVDVWRGLLEEVGFIVDEEMGLPDGPEGEGYLFFICRRNDGQSRSGYEG